MATKRRDSDDKDRQAATLNEDAVALYTEADALQADAETKQTDANAAQQRADELAELAENTTVASEKQHFGYDQAGRLTGRYADSGDVVREYFGLGSIPVAVSANEKLYNIHVDHLGTPRVISDPRQVVIWNWISDVFGTTSPVVAGDRLLFNLRFPGQYIDQITQYHYNLWRTYNPSVGRYTRPDPIGLKGGVNPYSYAQNTPVRFTDIVGLHHTGGGCVDGAGNRVTCPQNVCRTAFCAAGIEAEEPIDFRTNEEVECDDCKFSCELAATIAGPAAVVPMTLKQLVGKAIETAGTKAFCAAICRKECKNCD